MKKNIYFLHRFQRDFDGLVFSVTFHSLGPFAIQGLIIKLKRARVSTLLREGEGEVKEEVERRIEQNNEQRPSDAD